MTLSRLIRSSDMNRAISVQEMVTTLTVQQTCLMTDTWQTMAVTQHPQYENEITYSFYWSHMTLSGQNVCHLKDLWPCINLLSNNLNESFRKLSTQLYSIPVQQHDLEHYHSWTNTALTKCWQKSSKIIILTKKGIVDLRSIKPQCTWYWYNTSKTLMIHMLHI